VRSSSVTSLKSTINSIGTCGKNRLFTNLQQKIKFVEELLSLSIRSNQQASSLSRRLNGNPVYILIFSNINVKYAFSLRINIFRPRRILRNGERMNTDALFCFSCRFLTSKMSSKVKQVADAAAPVVKRDVNKFIARIRQFFMLVGVHRPFGSEIEGFFF
jgi:hypothetical protein